MLPQEIIRRKRDGAVLSAAEIADFVRGIGTGEVSEGQIGAFTMAVYLNGMTTPERVALSLAMRDSGTVIDWSATGIDEKLLIEKHSSGGVGDEKITLLVVPLAAACGVFAPNLSGWGLDYCGGEIDMLDSIPGYDTAPSSETFVAAVKAAGGAIIGPTPDLAPADRKIFKVRDVTATVESVALITGSIMSKKLAAGPRGMVITVGSGSGAYMATVDDARELAESMSEVAAGAGLPSVMLLTDLNAFVGTAIGAATEVIETVDFLTGRHRDARVAELTLTVTAEMIVLAGLASDIEAARSLAASRLEDGSAAAHFGRMVAALGGPSDFVERPAHYLPAAGFIRPVLADGEGFVAGMNTKEIGLTLVALGGGRKLPEEAIDLSVGVTDFRQIGDAVGADHPLCVIHARDEAEWERAAARVRAAVQISDTQPPAPGPIIIDRIERRP
ncbi:MAG: thymidine phosphorylase [Bauldia sp.]|uniref:thymidine phosphorylase n=1 Tax=Bauldia sp. TaxID=2575872 RepID=UPI001D8EFD38|nr:thymidine phosphorylase [Bauldia sp.]MCB1496818.1 thymidine phosphorylase [Bauldia sp.]